ncbi:MAG: hypothetical protein JWM16_2336 [Verrucomicrobiales bacterium]|nr:hypothetical protein [Verrucomicrobiales bacterium]
MKNSKRIVAYLFLLTLTVAALGLWGCASTKHQNTESLLSTAGFHTVTPSTPQQQACYAALPPYKLQRNESNGKVVYAYADKKAGVVYMGGENEYQRYKQLGQQQKLADEQLAAAQMNQDAAANWDYWGYWGTPEIEGRRLSPGPRPRR